VAQRLVTGISPVTAAVGMQFDIEDVAAVEFSKAFYENLLQPDVALDEVVTQARKALVMLLQAGHRAWITPAVYWRCKDGKVFHIDPSRGTLDDHTLAQIRDIDIQLGIYRAQVEKIAIKSAEERAALKDIRVEMLDTMERLQGQRGELVGESVSLQGARAKSGQEIRCRLSLRARQPGTVSLVRFTVEYPAQSLTFNGTDQGADAAGLPLTAVAVPGAVQVVFVDPGAGNRWLPKEYELGFLKFTVNVGMQASILDLKQTVLQVTREGSAANFRSIDGMVFLEGD
jgi:hypothetical protein